MLRERRSMGFITVEVAHDGASKPATLQLSDARLQLAHIINVISVTLRTSGLAGSCVVTYVDIHDETRVVESDGGLVDMFSCARAIAPARLQVN